MKSLIKILGLFFFSVSIFNSCEKEDNGPQKLIVKLGAQSNTTIGAFYSIDLNKIYKDY